MFGTSFSRISTVLLALASVSLVVTARKGKEICTEYEFWWVDVEVCLPHGGLGWRPSTPSGISCPQNGWYWHPDNQCCVPQQPSPPTPTCGNGWDWNDGDKFCKRHHKNPQPSGHYNKKRSHKARSVSLCPSGLTACPVGSLTGGDYECLDTKEELESCGGCASKSEGEDCTAIKGAWNVGCEVGKCIIYTCSAGYKLSPNGRACVSL